MIYSDEEQAKDAESEPPGSLRVGIAYNLKKNIPSDLSDAEAEFDEVDTIRAIQDVLETAGYAVTLYEALEDLPIRLLQDRPDIVFNIAEGMNGRGREAQVPAILNFMGIPFTGSDETALCIAMDKALTKRLVASYGINTPAYRLSSGAIPDASLSFPLILKPNTEGSSKGITNCSIVEDAAELRTLLTEKIGAYKQDMLVEEYIPGREFTVGILGNGDSLQVFPPMEIIFNEEQHSIYSYEVKREFQRYVRYECPANISPALQSEIVGMAQTVFQALDCRDVARMDFRLSPDGRPYFIEINPLPGLAPGYSDLTFIAGFCGMDYAALVLKILHHALSRYGIKKTGQL